MSKIYIDNIKLELPNPVWNSDLAIIASELEKLRVRVLSGTTPACIFFEIKDIFQILESLGSARIEGNNTTISELVENIIENDDIEKSENLKEIFNITEAIDFINAYIKEDTKINKSFITEIHKIVVKGLIREGAKVVGDYRKMNIVINKSEIMPPDFLQVEDYMNTLFDFINDDNDSHNHLFRIAIAHHYFTFIHPFDNGNGRVVRLLTFAMLIKYGFKIKHGSILNPTAIFCNDRDYYYKMLNIADNGKIEPWCVFVLKGLKKEIEKIDKISNIDFIRSLFIKVFNHAFNRKYINKEIFEILMFINNSKSMTISAGDLGVLKDFDTNLKRSRLIRKLKDLKFIKSIDSNSRVYTLSFKDNYLLRSLMVILKEEGFIPESMDKNTP